MWRAVNLHIKNGDVAIKLLQPQTPKQINLVSEELCILQRIQSKKHENVAMLLDYFTVAPNLQALVLEYCEGYSLQSHLNRKVRLEERDARAILLQILSATRHLNYLGIIHYDLKPENIMFDALWNVKIVDFGWSKVTDGATVDGSVELPCLIGGTTWYKPPEGFMPCGAVR